MNVEIENYLKDNGSALYKAIFSIPQENYLEFFKKIATKQILKATQSLIVKIYEESMIDTSEIYFTFSSEYKKYEDRFRDFSKCDSTECSGPYSFDLFGYAAYSNNQITKVYTTLWQQFLSENLGEKFYRKLVAVKMNESLERQLENNKKVYNGLVDKLGQTKKEQTEIEKHIADFKEQYADVLDENGNVLPIEDADTKNV